MIRSKRGSLGFYLLVSLLVITGILTFVVILLYGIGLAVDGLEQLEVEQVRETELTRAGTYTVFVEKGNLGESFANLQVVDAAKRELIVHAPRVRGRYSYEGRRGEAVCEFTVVEPGTYVFHVNSAANSSVVLAVGVDFFRQMVLTILVSLAVLLLALLAAGMLIFRQLRLVAVNLFRD